VAFKAAGLLAYALRLAVFQVVPTDYIDKAGIRTNTNQFSVTENFRESAEPTAGGRSLPGVFFFYDLSPIKVRHSWLSGDARCVHPMRFVHKE
jgi:hypothetical protein